MNRPLFSSLTKGAWQNLAIAAVVLVYVTQVVLDLLWGNLFGNLGVDFAAFWSAGHIANQYGYRAVYDLDVVGAVQRQFLPERALITDTVRILPTAYLPLFLLPFQVLGMLPPASAFAFWTLLNFLGSVLYIGHFAARMAGSRAPIVLPLLLMISLPVFENTFLGQSNLWLMICLGEFMLAQAAGRDLQSGAWLAGLLLKPQCLFLIVPAILLQRRWKAAIGTLVAGAAVIVSSWMLAGTDALTSLLRLWMGYVGGLPTSDPQLMMNWRMIGINLEGVVGSDWARAITLAGTAVTIIAALMMSLRPYEPRDHRATVVTLGILASTALVAWHSHVHMAMVLVPPLLALAVVPRLALGRVLHLWIWLPIAIYIFRIFIAALARAAILPDATFGLVDLMGGLGLFLVNLMLVMWSLRGLAPSSSAGSRLPA